jgi:hypothetical protein
MILDAQQARRSPGHIIGVVISAVLLAAANLVTLYLVFLAFAVAPDGPWDVDETASTARLMALVGGAAADEGGYRGNWALALGATRLRGRRPYLGPLHWGGFGSIARYSQDTYAEATGTTWAELAAIPGAITRRLVGPLLRGLDVQDRYDAVLSDPAPAAVP